MTWILAQAGAPSALMLAAAAVAVVVGFGFIAVNPRFGLAVPAVLLFFSALGVSRTADRELIPTIISPVELYRSEICGLLGLGILLAVVLAGGFRAVRVSGQVVILILIGIYGGLLRTIHSTPIDAGLTIGMVFALQAGVGIFLPMLIRDRDDILRVLRYVGLAATALCGLTALQLVVNPAPMLLANRFSGFSTNPQSIGLFCSIMTGVTVWLALFETRLFMRVVWLLTAATLTIFALWTGSRTAFALTLLVVTAVAYRRVGKVLLLAPVAGVLGLIAFTVLRGLIQGEAPAVERITSLENTRAVVWQRMWIRAMERPILGWGVGDAGGSENSFLYAFASGGVGMAALVVALYAVTIWLVFKVWRARKTLAPRFRSLADLVIGVNGAYLAASVTEGIMITRVGPWLMIILVTSVVATHLHLFRPDAAAEEQEGREALDAGAADDEPFGTLAAGVGSRGGRRGPGGGYGTGAAGDGGLADFGATPA